MRLISLNIAQNILNFTRMHYLFFSYILFAISAYSKEYKTPKLTIDSNYIPNMTNVSIFALSRYLFVIGVIQKSEI